MIKYLRVVQKFIRYKDDEGREVKEYTSYSLEVHRDGEWEEVPIVEIEEPMRLVVSVDDERAVGAVN